MQRWTTFAALAAAAVGSQLSSATASAELHNVTYVARVDGPAPGSTATFMINDSQTNTANLSSLPSNAFQANAVLADPAKAGMQVAIHWPTRRTCTARSTSTTTSPARSIRSSDRYKATPTR